MDAERLSRLTEQQRACLRFVDAGMSSKEIAPRLGIEPGSVDQHLKSAMRVLGVSGRHKAARLLLEWERSAEPKLVYHSPEIAAADDDALAEASTDDERQQQGSASGKMLHEEQAPFEAAPSIGGPALPLPIWGAKPHDLNWAKRLGWIVAAAIGIALAFGALVSAIETLVRLKTG